MGRSKGAKNRKGTNASRTKEAQLKSTQAMSTDGTPQEPTRGLLNWITSTNIFSMASTQTQQPTTYTAYNGIQQQVSSSSSSSSSSQKLEIKLASITSFEI